MEEQSWFFTQIYNIYQMDQIWQNACVLWIRQLTWKQDFSRVNNRREVQLDKDAWNTSKFKKIKKKCHFKKIECSLRAFWPKLDISIKWVENEYRLK